MIFVLLIAPFSLVDQVELKKLNVNDAALLLIVSINAVSICAPPALI
jgi:hypothetical protein